MGNAMKKGEQIMNTFRTFLDAEIAIEQSELRGGNGPIVRYREYEVVDIRRDRHGHAEIIVFQHSPWISVKLSDLSF